MAEIRCVSDLVAAAHQCDEQFPRGGVWWRGQPRVGLPLIPRVLRAPRPRIGDEQTLAHRFRLKATARHPRCPRHDDHAGWLFLMQHYGYATRLLDWTESPLIAAFFAVGFERNDGEPAEVFALEPSVLNEVHGGNHSIVNPVEDSFGLLKAAFNRNATAPQFVLAMACDEIDIRMVVQQSVFTIHGTEVPLDAHPKRDMFLRSFVVPAAARVTLAREVLGLGFTRASLFPDLENLSKDLLMQYGRAPWSR
jgi:hypothetical protein